MQRKGFLRRTPMRRGKGFGKPFPSPPHSLIDDSGDLREPRTAGPGFRYSAPIERTGEAEPKREYVRDKNLMKVYRLIACQHCGANNQTVCGAHSNWEIHGKGGHIKADDNRCASLCGECHADLDQGSKLIEEERQRKWWNAHVKTINELVRRRLWPAWVPLPDISHYPEQWT